MVKHRRNRSSLDGKAISTPECGHSGGRIELKRPPSNNVKEWCIQGDTSPVQHVDESSITIEEGETD